VRRIYHYVGPAEIKARVVRGARGYRISSLQELLAWARTAGPEPRCDDLVAATFVIDDQGDLLLADRHSEHVACAGGGPVLSAGEMFFRVEGSCVRVDESSNQSTGYCPEPESWPAVAAVLNRLGVAHAGDFTLQILFRRCNTCGERNVVKDNWFVCGICGSELPEEWNFS
jgi:hypothetical protein